MLNKSRRMRRHISRVATLALFAAAAMPHLFAQGQASDAGTKMQSTQPLRFELSSIRPTQSVDDSSSRRVLPGGRFVATGTSVRTLIRVAFGTDDNRMQGAPGWIDHERFDITATTVDHAEINTPEQFQQVLRALLADRFGFTFHTIHEEGPVFWLEVAKPGKLGPGLKPSGPASQPNVSVNSNNSVTIMKVTKTSMTDIAATLRRQAGRPVEDHTNLSGTYDFEIKWSPEPSPDSTTPSLVTVLQDELSLKLRPAKGNIETLVIDRIEHPSEN